MPYCGVHYLWFAFVCFFMRSRPHPPTPARKINSLPALHKCAVRSPCASGIGPSSLRMGAVAAPLLVRPNGGLMARGSAQAIASGEPPSPPPWRAGGSEAKTRSVYLKSASNFRPFNKFHFSPEENVSDVGGGVCRPGLARAPNNPPPPPTKALCQPPPPGSLSNRLVQSPLGPVLDASYQRRSSAPQASDESHSNSQVQLVGDAVPPRALAGGTVSSSSRSVWVGRR